MSNQLALTLILACGIAAQFIAWRLKLPSILLLLIAGFILGPATGWMNPDALFGEFLFPAVGMAVGVILFEGGLSLKIREFKATSGVVQGLVSVGILVTWVLASLLAHFTLDLSWSLALLLGAILTVTGPTVVIPMLMLIRPKGRVNTIVKWEGILNDPIGALLAVLVYEAIIATNFESATTVLLSGFPITLVVGVVGGLVTGWVVAQAIRHHWVPEFLTNTFTLSMVIGLYTVSNMIQHESGLFSVTVMGIYLGNQKKVSIRNLVGFKEDLRVLLISSLFIILAARMRPEDLAHISVGSFVFLLLLILAVRPAAVYLSTLRSDMPFNEKLFVSMLAPRGIVAAAVTSLFASQLIQLGVEGAEKLVPNMFFIIVGTILIYGLSARPLAKKLDLADEDPQGCVILGSNLFSRTLAKALQSEKIPVLIVDAQWSAIKAARMEGIPTLLGNVLSDKVTQTIDYTGMGRFLALTPNLELNSLACIRFGDIFGLKEVYQLGEPQDKDKPTQWIPEDLSGHTLFGPHMSFAYITKRLHHGATIKRTPITKDFSYEQFRAQYADQEAAPLCLISESGKLTFFTVAKSITPRPGQVLISLVGGV
ncbi:MAG: sodium:proton antiporter [Gammaproteobacteria bacterium]|nr:MAG: sodium:proton antiporter [Gammaproteobacteria bacterium]